jgi:hypothetical protein
MGIATFADFASNRGLGNSHALRSLVFWLLRIAAFISTIAVALLSAWYEYLTAA